MDREYLGIDIEKLCDNKGCKSDRDNVCERLFEEYQSRQHDDTALKDRFPDPNKESFCR